MAHGPVNGILNAQALPTLYLPFPAACCIIEDALIMAVGHHCRCAKTLAPEGVVTREDVDAVIQCEEGRSQVCKFLRVVAIDEEMAESYE